MGLTRLPMKLFLCRFNQRPTIFLKPSTWTCNINKTSRTYSSISASKLQFGQPLHETHPHLLKPGELTPGITALEYSNRRSRLCSILPDNSVAILASSPTKYRSGAVFYEFHQEPNFFYLTGFNEPEAVAVIQKFGSSADHIFHLYVRPKDYLAEQWSGARSGERAAIDVFNADESGDINDIQKLLSPHISQARQVFTDICKPSKLCQFFRFFYNKEPVSSEFQALVKNSKVDPLQPLMNDLRITKSQAEIDNMYFVGRASGLAFSNTMRREWTKEKDLRNFLEFEFCRNGCDTSAYVPVVAGGSNALGIHYVRNDDALKDGQLVLVDAGGEYGGYITDISRTWPVNGKFSDAQRDLYEAILEVQRYCVSLCRENAEISLDEIHSVAERSLTENLRQIGFDMSGNAIKTLFPHHLGHFIGLDVHDSPEYPRYKKLKAGNCITVEPGLYVPRDDEHWPKHFRGMGIRIEDSVCVQNDTPLIFTTSAVKEVIDIESLRS
ncbi:Intermediate cleaving peptidase 55 [Golovinomyces cichoracearum]|uniref:Xaa-Pro aminopeptidase n=1 Tax=Golovinomyces cichoracearum TaxID=62708 RepID=A0A420IJ75_9PEZI|nr:Intermediate cleaving peptidase 55 [Golovinomyces cichoracearum]